MRIRQLLKNQWSFHLNIMAFLREPLFDEIVVDMVFCFIH